MDAFWWDQNVGKTAQNALSTGDFSTLSGAHEVLRQREIRRSEKAGPAFIHAAPAVQSTRTRAKRRLPNCSTWPSTAVGATSNTPSASA